MIQPPSYYRTRSNAIANEIRLQVDDRQIKILQNGYFPGFDPSSYEFSKGYRPSEDNTPLTFRELCSLDTWFAMHPEKVCGETVITTSREFPLAVKAARDDVIRTVTAGMECIRKLKMLKIKLKSLKTN